MVVRCTPFVGFVLAVLSLAPGRPAARGAPAGERVLENSHLRIGFDEATGRLVSIHDLRRGFEHVAPEAARPFWTVDRDGAGALTPDAARSVSWEAPDGPPASGRWTWTDFGLPEAPALRVVAEIALETDRADSRWRLRLENLGTLVVRAVHFPRLGNLGPRDGESLVVPQWMGERTEKARALLNPAGKPGARREWGYPGILSMQFLSLQGADGSGLLLATHDPSALQKRFAILGDGSGGLALEAVHLPAANRGDPALYAIPYDIHVTLHEGGWHGAAGAYRTWAREQPWFAEARRRRGLTPEWVRDTGLWVWNRGRSEAVLEPARLLQEEARLPVSVFWHWWHGCAYDAGFPEYLPPREGAGPFRAAVARARADGIHALVYMNQRLWGMTTASWTDRGAAKYAVKRPDGGITPEVYNTFLKVPCASMCMGTPFWRDTYAGLATEAVRGLGVAGIYMDQACSSLECHDPAHGHPPGGGSYWMEGFRKLSTDIREGCTPEGVALAGEGCGEAWLPYLDAMLSLQVSMERYAAPGEWEPVPLFQAVYHDAATLYGNYSSLTRPPYDELWPAATAPAEPLALLDRKFATQFRLEQARAFAWGQQPTLANFTPQLLVERRAEIDFVLQLARLRRQLLPFLQDGTLLPPLDLEVPPVTIPMSRLSIYAGQQDAVKEFTKAVPPVVAAAWQAPDGRVAVVLVNITDEPVSLPLRLHAPGDPIPPTGSFRVLDGEGTGAPTAYRDGRLDTLLTLPPATARIVVCE